MHDELNNIHDLLDIELESNISGAFNGIEKLIPMARDMDMELSIYRLVNTRAPIKGLDYLMTLVNKGL